MGITLGQVLTNLEPEMKTTYKIGLVNTVEYAQFMKKGIIPGNTYTIGYEFKIPYQVALSEGGGMFSYNDPLAKPGGVEFDKLTGSCKDRNLAMLVYGKGEAQTQSEEMAYVKAVATEIQAKATAENLEQRRMWYGYPGKGIGKFTAAGASHSDGVVTVTLDPYYTGYNATKYIRRGMLIALYDGSVLITNGAGTDTKGLKVLSKNRTTFRVSGDAQLATDINTAGTHGDGYVFIAGAVANPEYNGLWSLIGSATNTVHSINRTTAGYEWYVPLVYKMTADGLTLAERPAFVAGSLFGWEPLHLTEAIDETCNTNGADKNDLRLVGDSDMERYIIQQQRNMGEQIVRGKFVDNWPYETIKHDNVPFMADDFCWPNCIGGVNQRSLMQLDNQKLDWTPMGQTYWNRYRDSNGVYDAYDAYGVERGEHSIKEPAKNFWIWGMKGARD